MELPIHGAQVPPPVLNHTEPICICVPKIYDFVIFTEDISTIVPLPTTVPEGCPTTVTDITCSLAIETSFFPITCVSNEVCTILDRRPINIDGVNASLVKLKQDIPVDLTLTGTDDLGKSATCTFSLLVSFIRQIVLCFPLEFTDGNLICRTITGNCTVTTPPPVGGTPLPASVGLEINLCKEVQVLAAVNLEALAKPCSPRAPIEIPVTSVCPLPLPPQQCDFFPQQNCDCQSTFNSTGAAVPGMVAVVVNGVGLSVGTASLVGNICNQCSEMNTSITFAYMDTDGLDPNHNFTFTANSFTMQTCTFVEGIGTQVVTGAGTVVTALGDVIPVTYSLTLVDNTPDSYSLIITSDVPGIFTASATSINIGDNKIIIQDCTTFPSPPPDTCDFLIYVTNAGAIDDPTDDSVSVIDTATNTVTSTITVGNAPLEIAVTPNGARAYVTNFFSNTVTVMDTETNMVIATVPVGVNPLGVAVSPNGTTVYVANHATATISVINTVTNTVIDIINVGGGPQGIAFSPNGLLAYVANEFDGTISVINTATNTVIDTITVGTRPRAISFLPDGTRAYVTNQDDNTVSVIDTATNTVIDTINVGSSPVGIDITLTGTRAYIVNKDSNNVTVINTTTNTVIDNITVGSSPDQITITPDGTRAYVTNQADDTVSVIDLATNTVIDTISVGDAPTGIASGTRCL